MSFTIKEQGLILALVFMEMDYVCLLSVRYQWYKSVNITQKHNQKVLHSESLTGFLERPSLLE